MYMIWHYYRRNDGEPFAIEVAHPFSHDFCAIAAPQNAGTMASIQPAFNRAREPFMILALDVGAPRLRMNTQPCFTFRLPAGAQVIRHSIGKSKRNEINCSILLPMWQAIGSETNIGVRIKEAEFSHRGVAVFERQRITRARHIEKQPLGTRRTRDRRSLVQSSSSSSSSSRLSNNRSVLSIGAGVVMSTPAVFSVSRGNFEPPERRKSRYASTDPGSPESTRCESATAAEMPVAYL